MSLTKSADCFSICLEENLQ
ncbi:hypothetical protein U0070_009592, partial [Myodes glareolus]